MQISEEISATVNVETSNQDRGTYQRPQNRRVTVMLYQEMMSDGKTIRIKQILDKPIKFSIHREFLDGLNAVRAKIYGPDVYYDTKNVEIPEGDGVVHCVVINSATGKLISHKVFTSSEAREYLAKIRDELDTRFQARKNESSEEFGTSLQDAMQQAGEKVQVAAN